MLQHECLCVRSHQHAKLTIKPSIRSFDVNIASIPESRVDCMHRKHGDSCIVKL